MEARRSRAENSIPIRPVSTVGIENRCGKMDPKSLAREPVNIAGGLANCQDQLRMKWSFHAGHLP